nr:DUF1905 domain-containing protein [uncultured Psychroserpens sp.]
MNGKIEYEFFTKMWKHDSPGGWHFVSLPKNLSKEIRKNLGWQEEGWGRMKAIAEIKELRWETAIWFDTKMDSYVLPIKAEIRKKLSLEINKKIEIRIWV